MYTPHVILSYLAFIYHEWAGLCFEHKFNYLVADKVVVAVVVIEKLHQFEGALRSPCEGA